MLPFCTKRFKTVIAGMCGMSVGHPLDTLKVWKSWLRCTGNKV